MRSEEYIYLVPEMGNVPFDATSQDHWERFLECLQRKEGIAIEHRNSAAFLLTEMSKGVRWAIRRWTQLPADFLQPQICLGVPASSEQQLKGFFGYNMDKNIIFTGPETVRRCATAPPGARIKIRQTDSKVVEFDGTMPDFFFLGGVEEGDHAVWMHRYPDDRKEYSTTTDVSIGQYLASDHEYHALQMQMEAAIQYSMPAATVAFIHAQLELALRERQGR